MAGVAPCSVLVADLGFLALFRSVVNGWSATPSKDVRNSSIIRSGKRSSSSTQNIGARHRKAFNVTICYILGNDNAQLTSFFSAG